MYYLRQVTDHFCRLYKDREDDPDKVEGEVLQAAVWSEAEGWCLPQSDTHDVREPDDLPISNEQAALILFEARSNGIKSPMRIRKPEE